jgi:PST family polysaccharide transporter
MTTVDQGSGQLPGLAVDDGWVPHHAPCVRTAPALRAPSAWQLKADARVAARALHEAMTATEARRSEPSSELAHGGFVDRARCAGVTTEPADVGIRQNGQEPPAAGATDQLVDDADRSQTLSTHVSHGVKWGAIAAIATQVGRLAFMTILMRLLGPHNFGIVGQAAVFIAITQIFLHLGMATYIIQRPRIEKADVGSAVWLNVIIGSALAGLTLVAAPVLRTFFGSDELTAVLRVLSIAFLLKGLAVVPTALLNRRMRFRSLGGAEIAATFIGGTLGVAAAVNGAGYWALVIQTLTFDGIYLAIVLAMTGWPELTWSSIAARRLWSFGSRVMGADLVNYVSDNGDKFLIARFLGATPLALYTLAYRVIVLPVQLLTQSGRVILPTFSRLQDDRERLGRALLRASETLAFAICPGMTLTILCAPIGVPLVFGDAWAPAVLPVQLLAVTTVMFVLAALTGSLVLAVGRADWELRWSLVTMVVAIVFFSVGLHWGIVGVAAAYLILGLVLNPIRFLIIQRLVPITARGYLRALGPAVVCSAALCGVWLLTATALRGVTDGLALLATASTAGLAGYVLAARFLWPDDLRRQLDFGRQVIRGRVA